MFHIISDNHEAIFDYDSFKSNQYYDHPPPENYEASKNVPVENIWDLKTPFLRKPKREYLVDFRYPWVTKPATNRYENPANAPVNQVFMGQARSRLNAWRNQWIQYDEETFYDHILDLFPSRSPNKKPGSSNQEEVPPPRKRFYPLSMEVVNPLNTKNKQLLIDEDELKNDPEFLFLLYHFLLLSARKKQKYNKEWTTKLIRIRKRNSQIIPNYVGNLFHGMKSVNHYQNVSI